MLTAEQEDHTDTKRLLADERHARGLEGNEMEKMRSELVDARALCVVAEEAQEIIDQTRTSEFGLSVKKLKAFLDELLHPAGCFRLAEVAGDCCELDPTRRPDALELTQPSWYFPIPAPRPSDECHLTCSASS